MAVKGLSTEVRESVAERLNIGVATLIDLKARVKHSHWNLRGPGFISVHELLDEVADEVDDFVDLAAERIAQLGGVANGLLESAVDSTVLGPREGTDLSVTAQVGVVSAEVAEVANWFRETIDVTDQAGDKVTADLATEVARGLDVLAWKLGANL